VIATWCLALALPFSVETLAPGVTLVRDPAGTNTLVVERSDGLLLVDAQGTVDKGKALAASVAGISKKPVRWIVLTQPHVESWGGAAAFPGAILVAARGAREALDDPAFDPAAEYRLRFPGATTPSTRPRPTLLVQAFSLLDDAERPVELMPLPRAHSGGDLVVRLPNEKLVHVGDLVAPDRNPRAGPDARIGGWITQLNEIASTAPAIVVASRGPAVGDADLRRQREAIAWVRSNVAASFVDLVKVADIPARLAALPAYATFFDAAASPSLAPTILERAIDEAVEERRKRGLPVE
jgi:glyoxylase-like metal-dependent hydrolase (beta-lactamase superfamily II)